MHGDELEKALTTVFNEYSTDVVVKKLQLPIPKAMKASIMLLDQKILKLDFMGAVKVTIFVLLVA